MGNHFLTLSLLLVTVCVCVCVSFITTKLNPKEAIVSISSDSEFPSEIHRVKILRQASDSKLAQLGVASWPKSVVQMVPMGQLSMRKLSAVGKQGGKLWRWKRSHHQWIVQFKWKWQKPWRLSEWIRHNDETLLKAKPQHKALPNKIM